MNKQTVQTALKLFLLIIFALTSSCAPLTAAPSPTAIPAPSQTPSPTNTPEPIRLEGTLIYSDYKTIYSVDLQSKNVKSIYHTNGFEHTFVRDSYVYVTSRTAFDEIPYKAQAVRMNLDGLNIEQFLTNKEMYSEYSLKDVSPDGKYAVYYSTGKLIIVNTKTKVPQEIVESPSDRFLSLTWSFDSQSIYLIYMQFPENSIGEHMRLLQYSLANQKMTELLTDFPTSDFKWMLEGETWSWSPDGENVLLSPADTSDIYLFNTKSRSLLPVKVTGSIIGFHWWSRDGKYVLINVISDTQETNVFVLNTETGATSLVSSLTSSTHYGYDCDWSPNGKMLLCATNSYDLYLIDLEKDTSTHIQHVQGLEAYDKTSTFYIWNYQTVWSADDKYFAYITMSSSDSKDHKQDFILNIQSVNTGERLQIQIPRENEIEKIYWLFS